MADIVVGDIVARLRAEATQFNQAIADAIARLGQLTQATGSLRQQQSSSVQAAQQLAQSYQVIATAVRHTTDATTQATSAWRGMLAVAGGIGIATGLGQLAGQVKDFAAASVDMATRMQSLRASLSALGGGAAAGAQQFQQLFQTAQGLGIAFEPLARGWRTLTAAASQTSLTVADQQRLLTALATEARRVGASQDELGRAILAVGQSASKGRVSMEELRQQLGEAIPTALAAAALGMGQTTEALTKMVETGTLDFVPFAKALTRGFEEMQAASGKFAEGGREAFNRLGNAFLAFKDAVGTNVLPELERLAKMATGIFETATALLHLTAGRRDPRLAPNTASEIVGTSDQEKEVARLRALIDRLNSPATPAIRAQRGDMAQRAQQELDTLLDLIQATKDQAGEEAKETAEINKSASARERQGAFVQQLAKALEKVNQEAETFRQKAAQAPESFGRLGGSLEEAETFRGNLREVIDPGVKGIAGLIAGKAAGITVPVELAAQFAALRGQVSGLDAASKAADEGEKARLKTIRETEQARAKADREAKQDAESYQDAVDKVTMSLARQKEQAIETLQRLNALYSQPKEGRDLAQVASLAAQFPLDEAIQREAAAAQASIDTRTAYLAETEALKDRFTALKQNVDALRGQEEAQTAFTQRLRDTLSVLQAPREERAEARLRAQGRRQGVDLTPQHDALLQQITAHERVNALMQTAGRIGEQAAQTITTGLLSIVDGTNRVGEGFRLMAESILKSIAQITLNEGFSMLLKLGLGVATTALLGGAAQGTTGGGGSGFEILMGSGASTPFAAGGVVNKPTLAMVGEGPHNPEFILNSVQMRGLMTSAMRAGPSAGGQGMGGNVVIINVPNAAAGDREAAQQRALGNKVIINTIEADLMQGSGSRIGRMLKAGGH